MRCVCIGGRHVLVEGARNGHRRGLKIVGSVTADGLVEVNGEVESEVHCSLMISRKAHVAGKMLAERVVVDGTVEGPIQGGDVVLKSHAHVVADIHHRFSCH
jgi:cytoskeletal protein CcmA (bactofilin family)